MNERTRRIFREHVWRKTGTVARHYPWSDDEIDALLREIEENPSRVVDREGDTWERQDDGTWLLPGDGLRLSADELIDSFGPTVPPVGA
jgi:hypothetical protein